MENVVNYIQEEWYMIREMREKGMNITDISKKMGISRPTVRKYLREERYSG
jgi:predicted transcriptional regulator